MAGTGSGFLFIRPKKGKLPIGRELGNIEVEVTAGRIGIAVCLDLLNKGDHVPHMAGGLADHGGPNDIEPLGIQKEGFSIKIRDFQDRFTPFLRGFDHFVFALVIISGQVAHIGDIHHMGHFEAEPAQNPDQHIVGHIGSKIPDMSVVINRGTASVKARLPRLEGLEDL
jgi:hypothetical protein